MWGGGALGPDARNVSLDPFVEDAPLLPDVDKAADAVDGIFVQVQVRQVLKDLGHDGAELSVIKKKRPLPGVVGLHILWI